MVNVLFDNIFAFSLNLCLVNGAFIRFILCIYYFISVYFSFTYRETMQSEKEYTHCEDTNFNPELQYTTVID